MTSILDPYPPAFRFMAPELGELDAPDESRADCGKCHMIAPEGSATSRRRFHPDARCCTYHPNHPNFLVGRALVRGGVGARLIRKRMADRAGLGPDRLRASKDWLRRHYRGIGKKFGTDVEQQCPYWVGGEYACGVWADRGAICRTWFCRNVNGRQGLDFWHQAKEVLKLIENKLSEWAVAQGGGPEEGSRKTWEAWYRLCAERVEAINVEEAASLRDEEIAEAVADLVTAHEVLESPLPDVVVPRVSQFDDSERGVWLAGYSTYDARELPRTIFLLLSAMDGEKPWRQALAEAQEAGLEMDEAGFRDLYLAGLVGPDVTPEELKPGGKVQAITLGNVAPADLPFELE